VLGNGLEPRVIPVLQLENERFVKTKQFTNPVYVGDPINVLSIFNELAVDEIVLIDILASEGTKAINYDFLSNLTSHCFVPLSYGGGVDTLEQATRLVALGFEKVIINTSIIENPQEIERIVKSLGSQAVSASLDIRMNSNGEYEVWHSRASKCSSLTIKSWCELTSNIGVGEVLVTSIDREGTNLGYDFAILDELERHLTIPIVLNGGASNREDVSEALSRNNVSAAAGSLFVFQTGHESTCEELVTRSGCS
jgi:cyclase